jgi:hypothetical protein
VFSRACSKLLEEKDSTSHRAEAPLFHSVLLVSNKRLRDQ